MTPFFRETLNRELEDRIQRRPTYSLRAFARALGVAPSTLSRILAGKKIPGLRFAQRAFTVLELGPDEENRFLESLVRAKRLSGAKVIRRDLRRHAGPGAGASVESARPLDLDSFRVISDWYHYAILEMTFLEDSSSDHAWIARRLGISRHEVDLAVERLLALGLLARRDDSAYVKACGHHRTVDRTLTTAALRKRQRQVLEKSVVSLENDPIEARNHTAMTMTIDPALIPVARERIERFSQELCELLESGRRTRTYELSVTLFPLTKET